MKRTRVITCEYTVNGNECCQENCILDHTPVKRVQEPKKKSSFQHRWSVISPDRYWEIKQASRRR